MKKLNTLILTALLAVSSMTFALTNEQYDAMCYPTYDRYSQIYADQGYINNRALAYFYHLSPNCQEWIPQPSWSGDLWAKAYSYDDCVDELNSILRYYGYSIMYAPKVIWYVAISELPEACQREFGY